MKIKEILNESKLTPIQKIVLDGMLTLGWDNFDPDTGQIEMPGNDSMIWWIRKNGSVYFKSISASGRPWRRLAQSEIDEIMKAALGQPREMTGFLATLTPEQRKRVLG